jgi:crossover junction endodeoxyribonuclease RusA
VSDLTLPQDSDPPRRYRLELWRIGKKWITANQRSGWHARARATKQWREIAAWRAFRDLSGVRVQRARVVCELRFDSKRRRDPANWAPTAKAVIDGLVDAGVFPDDDSAHVVGPDMRLGPPQIDEVLVVHIFVEEQP